MTIKLFCSNCGYGEESDKEEFTILNGQLICKDCYIDLKK